MSEILSITDGAHSWGAYLARPSTSGPAVVVLHELFGVNADMRQTCDELAAAGFFALCPDLFWRQERGVDLNPRSPVDWDRGLALYSAYDRCAGVSDVLATVEAARSLQDANGKVGLLGYCFGALMAFLTAARGHVDAAVAFHGADTESYLDEARNIAAPFLMHLAVEDEFIPESAQEEIRTALRPVPGATLFSYPGCRHAFTRHGGQHFDAEAAALANQRTRAFLSGLRSLERPAARG